MVFPAPAGMNPFSKSFTSLISCVPRARGDEPQQVIDAAVALLCSPRPRG